jgi:hypothetical protein
MSWMGSRPRSTKMLEILMTYCDSCSTLAARSPSILVLVLIKYRFHVPTCQVNV